ncbi:efflux RND transporter periplasmic adaptor subunit [Sedimenticola selenatireducens]|uniref:Efflux transporter periplasmic adaptor subunit n=1 Tax=Sedimenticola selenatireducens TaxID=191960 RepID=A0A2N6CTR0_9GAMM|nr:efflux RND transporter periplasmic adaptor subunit [Sedimenticola selenatireducens]PLX60553.1 MAG: efflux transporter periplasmic adaptor subunit [Sedimenticola selenatireducens]
MRRLTFCLLLLLAPPFTPAAAAETLPTDSARLTTIPREYRLDGVVEAINQATISSQTSGQVMEILVDVDDFVEQGAVIIRLKDTEQRARLDQAEAELQAANAVWQEASRDYERTKEIFQRKLVAQSAMDKATASLKASKARQEAASAALNQAKEQLEYTRIRAPYAGIVTERLIETGETASPGQQLISGISLDQLRVSVDVPQSLIPAIRQQASAQVLLPDASSVAATAVTIFPFADPASGTFKVRLQLPTDIAGLFPGMLVKTRFEIGKTQELLIPAASVVYRSEVTAVYVIDKDNRLSLRHIQTGHKRNGNLIAVLAGLEDGERVALDPVEAGSRLKLQSKGSADE